ncbi:uncharacterized protein N7496_008931 [Penicillium cataractarum]|uniref:Uncharacterized protein n=1 Tax=Penicillium cataractarum TaxID=2100454 RepID=A0A9W9RZK8_9EURO|nr:uncharacterized protein N7496_008931 [Penicillium cataractarum]KAJ5369171.1 hypothetical protein N7496_008931 [Penicillium cataractarum]
MGCLEEEHKVLLKGTCHHLVGRDVVQSIGTIDSVHDEFAVEAHPIREIDLDSPDAEGGPEVTSLVTESDDCPTMLRDLRGGDFVDWQGN